MFFNLAYFCDLKVVAMLTQESEIVLKFYSSLCTFTILSHIHVGGGICMCLRKPGEGMGSLELVLQLL